MSRLSRLARRARRALLALLTLPAALAITGCGGDPADPGAEEATGTPDAPLTPTPGAKADGVSDGITTLTFDADFEETLTAPVVAGETLRVRYDLDRLPDCRGTQGGYPQWNITGYFAVDGGEARTFEVTRAEGAERVAVDALLDIPRGRDLAMWFSVNNRWGCVAWDSNYGENYRVALEIPAAEAVIAFGAGGDVSTEGELVAGGTLRIAYDLERLSECRGTQGGMPQWNVTGHLKVDDGAEETFEVSRVEGNARVSEPARLEVPAGRTLSLWFTASNRWGCFEADDADGQRHRFSISTSAH